MFNSSTIAFIFSLLSIVSCNLFAQNIKLEGGNIFIDGKFEQKTLYVYGNNFSFAERKVKFDTIMNITNKYVTPPLSEGHTHNLDGNRNIKNELQQFTGNGVAYVMVLTNYKTGADENKSYFNEAGKLQVKYANGGITSTLGHPFMIYEPRAIGIYDSWKPERFEQIKNSRKAENNAYWFMDNLEDVNNKLNKYFEQKPDLVKIYLLDCKNFEKTKDNGKAGDKGLSKKVAKEIVKQAHSKKLKVFAHIETFDDLKIGLDINVDAFAHMPNYSRPVEDFNDIKLSKNQLKKIKNNNILITPTLATNELNSIDYSKNSNGEFNNQQFEKTLKQQKEMFNFLKKSGFDYMIGSDRYDSPLSVEYDYLIKNNFITYDYFFKSCFELTPKFMYPERKVGEIKEGFEASFLILNDNPFLDLSTFKKSNSMYILGRKVEYKF
jgi:hypothetical protein